MVPWQDWHHVLLCKKIDISNFITDNRVAGTAGLFLPHELDLRQAHGIRALYDHSFCQY